ncbi:phosphatase PAP2 family protein [Microbacterium sp. Root166]|uniref:phosphatase PAP2 family protein n=1 Tax=Microbacterium sp. Root166 TaxID=1736478 RepID=UPI0009EA8FF8|nr:phosphatase PAP2 family protein [Microbacterium sp. Root166]
MTDDREAEPREAEPRATGSRPALVYLLAGLVLLALSVGFGMWIASRADEPFTIDLWWNRIILEFAGPGLIVFAQIMNWLGGGWFGVLAVPIAGAVGLVLLRRPWAAAFFVTAAAVSAGCVQVLKHLFGRVRPEEIIVVTDYGSFPSGHVANAATLAVTAIILFPKVWVWIAGIAWVVLMAISRTLVNAHWVSDTVGGAMVGAGAALVVAAVFAVPMARENASLAARRASLG